MIDLTLEQHEAATKGENRLPDPVTRATYVLLSDETYERMKELLDLGPLTDAEHRTILRGVWQRTGWDDPRMDAYDAPAFPEKP